VSFLVFLKKRQAVLKSLSMRAQRRMVVSVHNIDTYITYRSLVVAAPTNGSSRRAGGRRKIAGLLFTDDS
jgi:uncharacterized protein YlxP (DUF503 family)